MTREPSPARKRLFRWITPALVLVVVLVCAEALCRLLRLGYGSSPSVSHPVFHHWLESDYTFRQWGPYDQYGGFDVHLNSEGFPMREELPPATEPAIVFLGDSFTAALQVAEAERFVTRVGEALKARALSFGGSSFSPLLSRLQLEVFAPRLALEAVVLQLYSNDVDDDRRYAGMARRDAGSRIVAVPGPGDSLPRRLLRRLYLARALRKIWLAREYRDELELRNQGRWGGSAWSPLFLRPIPETYASHELETTLGNIREIRTLSRRRGARFFLLVIPDRGALVEGVPDYFSRFFEDFAAANGIRFIPLVEAFRRDVPEELFFPIDIHLTERGNEVVAKAVVKVLES